MSSFRRAGDARSTRKAPPGTRPSLSTGQLLTSMGVDAIDHLLGGGIAVGSVVLLEAQPKSPYVNVILKYFLSQGICHGHNVTLLSADTDPSKFIKTCPRSIDTLNFRHETKNEDEQADMKIAWRYSNLPRVTASIGTGPKTVFSKKFSHTFNLSQQVDEADITQDNVHCVDLRTAQNMSSTFDQALRFIRNAIEPFKMLPEPGPLVSEGVHRIGIHALGSSAWMLNDNKDEDGSYRNVLDEKRQVDNVCRFLHQLRAIARRSCSVFVVTVPDSILHIAEKRYQIHLLVDAAFRLEGFAGTTYDNHPALKEHHGFFKVLKRPQVGTLVPVTADTADLVFKLKKKELAIEKFHLPPELSDTPSRPQEDAPLPSSRTLCQPNTTKKDPLEF
eukprot:gene2826-5668_t